jgi:hypothetical protein
MLGDLRVRDDGAEQHEAPKPRVNHAAMNPHLSQSRGDCHRLVRYHKDFSVRICYNVL